MARAHELAVLHRAFAIQQKSLFPFFGANARELWHWAVSKRYLEFAEGMDTLHPATAVLKEFDSFNERVAQCVSNSCFSYVPE